MTNKIAPSGAVYVCAGCGKRSRDLYGDQRIDRGWHTSCTLNSVLCFESSLVFQDGRVVKAKEWESILYNDILEIEYPTWDDTEDLETRPRDDP